MEHYLIVLLSVIGFSVNFVLVKLYQNRTGTGLRISAMYNILSGVCSASFFFCINRFQITVTPFSLIMAALLTLFCGAYFILGFKMIAKGNMATYTLFLMLGGMILPYFFGIVFLNEDFTALRLIGLVLMAFSLILSGVQEKTAVSANKKPKHSWIYPMLCIAVFALNGFNSITSKLHQLPDYKEFAVSTTEFVFLTAVSKAVIFGIVYLILRLRDNKSEKQHGEITDNSSVEAMFRPSVLSIVVVSALVESASQFAQFYSASHLPATVLYPFVTGGVIVLTALAGRLCFGEKQGKFAFIGTLLCFAATFFFL